MKKDKLKQVAVFMDYSRAILREPFSNDSKTIKSDVYGRVRFDGETGDGTMLGNYRSSNNETHKHNIEINAHREYFKTIAGELMSYDEILVLGTGTAPHEFQNFCNENKKLHGKKITVEKSDYISDNRFLHEINTFFNLN